MYAGVLTGAHAPWISTRLADRCREAWRRGHRGIDTALVSLAGGSSWLVATYLFAVSLVSLLCVYLASEKYQVEIYDQRPGESRAPVGERG